MQGMDETKVQKRIKNRLALNKFFRTLFFISTLVGLIVLVLLIARVLTQGLGYFNWNYITSYPAPFPEKSGILAGLGGTIALMLVVAPVSIITGISTALYLEMYAKQNKLTRFIQVNISNLAGVPSIVYGLLGLTFFVYMLEMGYSLLAGGLTLSLLILPVIIVAAQEAIRSVPNDLLEASYGMGATKWQTILRVILPAAIPGMVTGSILALSRAIGETAPLIVVGAATTIYSTPDGLFSKYSAMPIQIYNWVGRPQAEWQFVAAAGIMVLLIVLLLMNATAVFIRNKFQKRL
ncbi:phosphate ABC transporter permease PstA [Pontibacillus sp. HMF3514]|uniref:phosphate ABC transporter permease PstA n=1 Tax=Pontibacillus sp. HMF3514 TaxID=2692425 RepID=UPI001916EBA3|nr:phosphate ABC transporter permease PstA [Pontibacillus sp. HMF3514]